MPSQTTDTTQIDTPEIDTTEIDTTEIDTGEIDATQLVAIEQRYERAKRHIADVAVPAWTVGPEHDTVTVDVRLTQALIPLPTTPATHARPRARRFWRSVRLPRWIERSLPAS
jgi:hypothetical protein